MSKINVTLNGLTEKQAYEIYFRLLNVTRDKDLRLTEQQIELAALIAEKPMEYILDSQKAPSGKSKKYELAERLKIKEAGIYEPLKELVDKGVMVKNEDDGFMKFTPAINSTRNVIKSNLNKSKLFTFDYNFNITVNASDT